MYIINSFLVKPLFEKVVVGKNAPYLAQRFQSCNVVGSWIPLN